MSILDELAEQLSDALSAADIPQSAVVTHSAVTGPEWNPTITTTPHSCLGWADDYSVYERAVSDVQVSDRRIFILCSSLVIEPAPGDTVSIAGGLSHSIITVQRDPAGACWELQARI